MAIKKQHEDQFGNSYQEAYFRVVAVSIDYPSKQGQAAVSIYKDKTARDIGKAPLQTFIIAASNQENSIPFETLFGVSNWNGNPLQVVYTYLKSTDAFKSAVDC